MRDIAPAACVRRSTTSHLLSSNVMSPRAAYPTPEHQRAAETLVEFFSRWPETEAVLLLNSCARGKATPDSCLDIGVLIRPEALATEREPLERAWQQFYTNRPVFGQLRRAGRFSVVHFDYLDGQYVPVVWDDGGGPDGFELGIGNHLVYGLPLLEDGDYLSELRARWLPYYDEDLRRERLAMVRHACLEDLEHIPWFVDRGLYFAAFDRLYKAFQEFLQALFIAHRVYPIAYNKWIREQVVEILGQPALYRQLPGVLEVSSLESEELVEKASVLRSLLTTIEESAAK
jgi:predicted nucleotidyltransferase